jgi:excisionase family DNA binding protein
METQIQHIHRKLDLLIVEVKKLQRQIPAGETRFGIQEAAKRLNLSVSRVYTLIYEGKLKPLQRSKYSRIQFNQEILNKYIHASKQ